MLFFRTARGVALTTAGQSFLTSAEQIEALIAGVPGEMARNLGMLQGLVTVRVLSDLVSPAFDNAMVTYHQLHPEVEIKLDIAPWRNVVLRVRRTHRSPRRREDRMSQGTRQANQVFAFGKPSYP